MKKTYSNLIILNTVFVTALLIANVAASKVVSFWGLTVPAAIVAYPLTFLVTDIIGEIWGKDEANRTVKIGVLCQLISLFLISIAVALPVAGFADNQDAFESILGQSGRMVVASLIAYLCSQSWDVWIFHKIRDAYVKKHGTTKGGKWIWNNVGTMTSQIIDTAIFITIGFWGVVPNLPAMIVSQYVVKWIYALLDTPFFYLLTRKEN